MNKNFGTVLCPNCNRKMQIPIKKRKNHIMGNIFSCNKIKCSHCSEYIDLELLYRELFEYEFSNILDVEEVNTELTDSYDILEKATEAIGHNCFLGVKKEFSLIRILFATNKSELDKYVTLFDLLFSDLEELSKLCRKNVNNRMFEMDIQQDFYIPTNWFKQLKGNVLTVEYLIEYLSLSGFFIIGDVFNYFFKEETSISIDSKIVLLRSMLDCILSIYDFLSYYDGMDWSLELDIIELITGMISAYSKLYVFENKVFGLSFKEKKKYIVAYDEVLKPRQKELVLENIPEKLFAKYVHEIIDREEFDDTNVYKIQELEKRELLNYEKSKDKEVVFIRNSMINGFLKDCHIKL